MPENARYCRAGVAVGQAGCGGDVERCPCGCLRML